jgi:hypothetical protein
MPTSSVSKMTTGQNMIKALQTHLKALIKPIPNPPKQRVIVNDAPPPMNGQFKGCHKLLQ